LVTHRPHEVTDTALPFVNRFLSPDASKAAAENGAA
jgi:hypothetical protein